jgi:hypothetical protein
MKTRHDLHTATTPQQFAKLLESASVSFGDILAPIESGADEAGLMLTGSIPEGLGAAESDVDLMLLTDQPVRLAADHGKWAYSRGADLDRVSLKTYKNGVELCIELLSLDRLGALVDAVDRLVRFSKTAGSLSDGLPLLEEADLKLLHQIRSGWVLRGAPVVSRWREKLGTALLPLYLAINNFVLLNEYFEDLLSHKDTLLPGGALHIGRVAATSAAKTIISLAGETNPNLKWTVHLLHKVSSSESQMSQLASIALPFLFPPLSADPLAVGKYVDGLASLRSQLEAVLKRDPKVASLLRAFERNVHYVGDI